MARFPVVEAYRAELRAAGFAPLDAAATDRLRRAYADMHRSNALEGVHPTPELAALFAMLVEERVPPAVSAPLVERYVAERIVAPARTGAGEG